MDGVRQLEAQIGKDGRVPGKDGPSVNKGSIGARRGIVRIYCSSGDVRITVRSAVKAVAAKLN